jgi:acetyl-CoA carboxylase biotin carboxyl carrier protein
VIDVQQVRELAELMDTHGLTEIKIRQGDAIVTLRKGPLGEPVVYAAPAPVAAAAAAPAAAPAGGTPAAPASAEDEGLIAIKSPMVGTFYASPDPDSPPFVQVGSQVSPTTSVCIIEAMKVFNEIKAECSGTIEQILVSNQQPVEYGQTLMLVRPK